MSAQADGRYADVAQVLARLREQCAVHLLVDLLVAVAADHHVVGGLGGKQFAVVRRPHVREEHQHVATVGDRGEAAGHPLRIGEGEPAEDGLLSGRMAVALVVGNHADEADLHPVFLHDDAGLRLRHGRRIAEEVGADDRELREAEHVAQHPLSGVELVVAHRRRVVPETVHQFEDRTTALGHVDVGVARPAVARVDQKDDPGRVAAGLHGRGQLREAFDPGMDVVRREQDDGTLAGSAGREKREGAEQSETYCLFHRSA